MRIQKIKSIGIIGGGTAGYLSALAIKTYFPNLKVTLIESDQLPIIGVGEATTPPLVDFLHRILGFDLQEFYSEVQPTLKHGTRFDWGFEAPYCFNYPFEPHETYLAKELFNDPKESSLQSLLMNYDKSFLYEQNGIIMPITSIFKKGNYAYHLENRNFVSYLKKKAISRGILQIIDTIQDVQTDSEKGSIKCLNFQGGNIASFDFYIDCTGFVSMLLENSLKVSFVDYSSSLFTNTAITATIPNGKNIKPYTTAMTMNHGWLWNTPLRDNTHIGYVHSNQFASEEEIIQELKIKNPEATDFKLVRFRSGRHEFALKYNVLAIGNSFGFVEPLESSGIHMIVSSLKVFAEIFKDQNFTPSNYDRYNFIINDKWDQLRWFLALHFKFNNRLDTPFWRENREYVNYSGYENLINLMKEVGPLRQAKHMRNIDIRKQIQNSLIKFSGLDTFMVAQGILPNARNSAFINERAKNHKAKVHIWNELSKKAIPHKEALEIISKDASVLGNHP